MDESPYTGPRTRLQSQRNHSEIRVAEVMERFGRWKTEINEWEMLLNSQDVIIRQFDSLSRVIQDLARETLLQELSSPCVGRFQITGP